MQPLPVHWIRRDAPLTPSAAVAFGNDARALAHRVLALDDEHCDRLTAAASTDLLLVLGAEEDLPWIDGVIYVGEDARAAGLLLPTTRQPDVPLDLFALAIAAQFADQPRPLAILDEPRCVIPLGSARRVDADALRAWLETLP